MLESSEDFSKIYHVQFQRGHYRINIKYARCFKAKFYSTSPIYSDILERYFTTISQRRAPNIFHSNFPNHALYTHTIRTPSVQYHLLTHPPLGNGAREKWVKLRERNRRLVTNVRTGIEAARWKGAFFEIRRSWPGRRCYAGLHTLTRSCFEEARVAIISQK